MEAVVRIFSKSQSRRTMLCRISLVKRLIYFGVSNCCIGAVCNQCSLYHPKHHRFALSKKGRSI